MSRFVIEIDRIGCDGRGVCAELLPELITLDDWGFPIVSADPVPESLMPMARLAVEQCPLLALKLRPHTSSAPAAPGRH